MALDLSDDLSFQRADWRAQRLGWGVMLLLILAAVTGLTGRGPLGEKTVGEAGLRVDYDWIMRQEAPGTMRFVIGAPATRDSVVRFWMSNTILNACAPERIAPIPEAVVSDRDRVNVDIRVVPGADSVAVQLDCEPGAWGIHRGSVGLSRGGPTVTVTTVVLP